MALSGYEYKPILKTIGDIAADSDAIVSPILVTERRLKISAIKFAADTAVTAADTNYQKIAVKASTTELQNITTGPAATGQSLVAGTFVSKTVADASQIVEAGVALTLAYTKTGAGMAVSGLTIQIIAEIMPE